MTSRDLLGIAWCRKPWLAAPVVIAAALAALIARQLERRIAYRAGVHLAVTEGAHADAVFALRSPELIEAVIALSPPGSRRASPAGLAGRIHVTVEGRIGGRDRILLEVESPSADEAERTASAVAAEAAKIVRAAAGEIAAGEKKRLADLDFRLEEARASVREVQRALAELKTAHGFDFSSGTDPVSASRVRLSKLDARLADHELRLQELDAAARALRGEIDRGPARGARREAQGAVDPPGGANGGPRTKEEGAARQDPRTARRLENIERELARLRDELTLTDAHPRVAALLAERSGLWKEPASPPARETDVAREQAASRLPAELADVEGERARVAAVVGELTGERDELSRRVRTEGAKAEREYRTLLARLERNEAAVARASEELLAAEKAQRGNRASRAALEILHREPARAVGESPRPASLAVAGAVLGFMIGGLLAALAETLDPVIRSGADVERHLDIPVLATVPRSLSGRTDGRTERRSGRQSARGDARDGRSRRAAAAVWLLVFAVAAAVIVVLFYPGWGRLKGIFAGGASTGLPWPAGVEAPLDPAGDRAGGSRREPARPGGGSRSPSRRPDGRPAGSAEPTF